MHGRLKVKTPADIAEAKRQEKFKKLEGYRKLTSTILKMHLGKVYTPEALVLTEKLLLVNPDYYTCWNYRRNILLALLAQSPGDVKMQMEKELTLTQDCIQKNPKSYWVWNHRRWTNELPMALHQADVAADWDTELKLCGRLLDLDSRNFHCWDYRRWVVAQAKSDPHSELDFTTQKINSNFSNYSAWHYRSKLLPRLYSADTAGALEGASIQESVLLDEFETVQSACFTEPDDQSAWLYQRWLLGRAQRPLTIQLHYAECTPTNFSVLLVFSHKVRVAPSQVVAVAGSAVEGSWRLLGAQRHATYGRSWLFEAQLPPSTPTPSPVIICFTESTLHAAERGTVTVPGTLTVELMLNKDGGAGGFSLQDSALTEHMVENMTSQLATCEELLELEPDSKWTLLTSVYMMQALDSRTHHPAIMQRLHHLNSVDPMRAGYYADLRTKMVFEQAVEASLTSQSEAPDSLEGGWAFTCQNASLTHIPPCELLGAMHTVDLSHNQIRSAKGCGHLWFARSINLDNNQVQEVDADVASLRHLNTLSLRNNPIHHLSSLSALGTMTSLHTLNLEGCPVTTDPAYATALKTMCPSLQTVDGVAV